MMRAWNIWRKTLYLLFLCMVLLSLVASAHFQAGASLLQKSFLWKVPQNIPFSSGVREFLSSPPDDRSPVYEINKLLLEELIEKRPEILSQMNEIYVERVKDTIRKVKSN